MPAGIDPERVFAGCAGAKGIVLAVSGGPDSTALMVLASRWSEAPPLLVVSVDHGLRAEAADEARLVAENATRLGLPSRIMRCGAFSTDANVMSEARKARYACLAKAAAEAGFDTVATAHHLDDQAETLLMRMARGSGVYGLAAMSRETTIGELRLVRPLLDWRKADLVDVANESGLAVVQDPSNSDPHYSRARFRGLLPLLEEHGLTAERLAKTAGRLGRAADALEQAADRVLQEGFTADQNGVISGPVEALAGVHEEIALRVVGRLLRAAAGDPYTPRLDHLETLYNALVEAQAAGGEIVRTLHGCVVDVRAGQVALRREWGRQGLERRAVKPGERLVWDNRFRIDVPDAEANAGESLTIAGLGDAGPGIRIAGLGHAVSQTLPALFRDGQLIAAPLPVTASERAREAHPGPVGTLGALCLVGPALERGRTGVRP
ncbi:tRNA(Ile)-lysidine synthase [Faunimonas pinastri]|uniref:tRNA(Ile)-lysidine synthase n=1 Tax=Faunimonas pinastri TaxID=1855383 RepID=A0A1H8Z7Q1_9HYPH|nr:tRNA(Ile)-lysidine synthase [Faunimonas pinastri]